MITATSPPLDPTAVERPASVADAPEPVHLLVVDNDLDDIEYLGGLLKGLARVSYATSTDEALRLARLHQPDLVLLDADVPGPGGFEVCRRLRNLPGLHNLPIVIASRQAEAEMLALQLGADNFLRKPFDDGQVLTRLRAQPRALPAPRREAPSAGPARILIIDDDPSAVQLVRCLLADVGECHFALNGAQALAMVGELRPDIVLLDIGLPDNDGFHVCKQLRANAALEQVPIMFITQSDVCGHEARALALGGDDFVRKPFSAPVLRARVRRLVDRKRSLERHLDQVDNHHREISDGRLAAVVEACKDAIIVADTSGHVVMANGAACDLLGLQAGSLARLQLGALLVTDADGRHWAQRSGGQRVPVEVSTSTEGQGADALSVHVLRDTRERDRTLALLRRQDEAAAARRATASMLSYIAHEIGNPVNVIKGFAQLMQAEQMPARQAEKLSHILDAVGRLGSLLADVGDVARMEAGQFLVDVGDVDIVPLAQHACAQLAGQALAAGLRLSAPQQDRPVHVRADARRLRQCLDNLLSNAIKYGRAGPSVEVEVQRRGADVALAVQDHGCGLAEEQLAHLFEPYNRLGRDGGNIPGTGLGLTLTRELVQAMGGRLLVQSEPGRGSRFEVLLPASPQQDNPP